MFTANQIVAHLVGDYILQSHWMATRKGQDSLAAFAHATAYSLPFLLLVPAGWAGVIAIRYDQLAMLMIAEMRRAVAKLAR